MVGDSPAADLFLRLSPCVAASAGLMTCNGLHQEARATHVNVSDAEAKQRMLRTANKCILLADSSKLGRIELAPICRIDKSDMLITGSPSDPALVAVELASETEQ